MKLAVVLNLLLLTFYTGVSAEPCTPGDQLWITKEKLFFGKKMLSEDKSPIILKPSKTCKKLFPFCGLGPSFAKTKKHVYFREQEVKGADPTSFEYVCDDYGKDKNHIYRQTKVFSKSDAKNFQLDADFGIYKTNHKIYNREGHEIPGADPKTLTKIMFNKRALSDYVMDKNAVYHLWGVKLKLNVKALKTFGLEYIGDDKNIYFRTKIIAGADPGSFKVLDPELHTAEDKTNIYIEDRIKSKR